MHHTTEFVWKHYNQTNSDEGVLDPNDLSNLMDDMMTELFIVHTERILAESDKKMSEDGIRKQIYRDLAPSMNGERTKAGLRRHMQATILQKLDPEGKMGGITQRNFEAKWAKTTDELLRAKVAQSKKCVIL